MIKMDILGSLSVLFTVCFFFLPHSEEQAKAILKNDKNAKNESSGDIVNSQGQMEYHQSNGQLAIMFRNMVKVINILIYKMNLGP